MSRRKQQKLFEAIRKAIGDPRAVIGPRRAASDDAAETVIEWQARAVMKTLEGRRIVNAQRESGGQGQRVAGSLLDEIKAAFNGEPIIGRRVGLESIDVPPPTSTKPPKKNQAPADIKD